MEHTNNPQDVLDAIDAGHNVFLTGSAGSGKTYLASHFAAQAKINVAMTATTGVAALNLGGETIHRFLGLGVAARPFEAGKITAKWDMIKHSTRSWDVEKWKLMQKIDAIIIDEVSMLRRDQFELMDIVLSSIRENNLPFGGVQMILVGDFLQLPPVVTDYDLQRYKDLKEPYCFQSDVWGHAGFRAFNLTTNYRQGEGDFLNALERIRVGDISESTKAMLNSRMNVTLDTKISPVRIFTHKVDVDKENFERFKQLPGEKYVSEAEYGGKDYDIEILKKECPADDKLYFCEGAQVMMLTNDSTGRWVNGSMGIIEDTKPVKVRLVTGALVEIPMNTWERVAHIVKKDTVETKKVASMVQYPFKLAYATTIHKSQGLTLDSIDLDLAKCFATGQAYVALSRGRTLNGITLRSWEPKNIRADSAVLKFYNL
jgi:ATP-dependent DNA helicase PIF1